MAKQEKRIRRKVRNSYLISTVSVALVLFLLGSVGFLILNALRATEMLQENITLFVMLDDNIDPETSAAVGEKLREQESVREVVFVPKAAAAEDFKDYIGSDFEEFLSYNPLPDSYEARLKAEASQKEVVAELDKRISSWKGVDEVVYQKNVIEQIASNVSKFNMVLLVFGGTLLVISLILLNNTIRVSIFSKRYVINTMKQVGASKWFIMKPFLWSSVCQGVYAALIATVMFLGLIAGLNEGIPDVMVVAGRMPIAVIIGLMLVGGVLISVIFTTFALGKFIRMNSSKIYLY